jgi:hypothetical protein
MGRIAARVGETRSAWRILVRKPKEKRPLVRRRGRWQCNIITRLVGGGFYKWLGISWPTEPLSAVEKGFCFMSQLRTVRRIDRYRITDTAYMLMFSCERPCHAMCYYSFLCHNRCTQWLLCVDRVSGCVSAVWVAFVSHEFQVECVELYLLRLPYTVMALWHKDIFLRF